MLRHSPVTVLRVSLQEGYIPPQLLHVTSLTSHCISSLSARGLHPSPTVTRYITHQSLYFQSLCKRVTPLPNCYMLYHSPVTVFRVSLQEGYTLPNCYMLHHSPVTVFPVSLQEGYAPPQLLHVISLTSHCISSLSARRLCPSPTVTCYITHQSQYFESLCHRVMPLPNCYMLHHSPVTVFPVSLQEGYAPPQLLHVTSLTSHCISSLCKKVTPLPNCYMLRHSPVVNVFPVSLQEGYAPPQLLHVTSLTSHCISSLRRMVYAETRGQPVQ